MKTHHLVDIKTPDLVHTRQLVRAPEEIKVIEKNITGWHAGLSFPPPMLFATKQMVLWHL